MTNIQLSVPGIERRLWLWWLPSHQQLHLRLICRDRVLHLQTQLKPLKLLLRWNNQYKTFLTICRLRDMEWFKELGKAHTVPRSILSECMIHANGLIVLTSYDCNTRHCASCFNFLRLICGTLANIFKMYSFENIWWLT